MKLYLTRIFALNSFAISLALSSCTPTLPESTNRPVSGGADVDSDSSSNNSDQTPGSGGSGDNSQGSAGAPPPTGSLSDMMGAFVANLDSVNDESMAAFRNDVMGMEALITGLNEQLEGAERSYGEAAQERGVGIGELISTTEILAANKKEERDDLFRTVQANETQLIETIFFEGPSVLLKWDAHLAKADIVREQFVIPEIMAVKSAMYAELPTLLVSNPRDTTLAIDQLITNNVALATATAPSFLARTLKIIVQLEERRAQMDPQAEELIQALTDKIEALKITLKLPFDLVDPNMFNLLVEAETKLITARETAKAITVIRDRVVGYGAAQADFLNALDSVYFQALAGANALMGVSSPVSDKNSGVIFRAMGNMLGIFPAIHGLFGEARMALGEVATKLQEQKDEATSVSKLTNRQGNIMGMMTILAESVKTLNFLINNETGCSKGEEMNEGPMIIMPINCGGDKQGIILVGVDVPGS